MSMSCQSVKYGIGQSRFINIVVPFIHRELRSDDRGTVAVTVFHDL